MAGHRYWRITLDATTPPRGLYSISELQFREVAGVAQVPSGGTMTAADTYPGLPASNLVDGNSGTYWASNAGGHQPQWLTYDYGAGNTKTIVEMAMIAEPGYTGGADSPTSITPGYSDDGVTWTYFSQVQLPPLPDYGTVVFAVPTTLQTHLVPPHPYYESRNDIPNAAGMQFSLVAATTFNRIGGMCGSGTLSPQTIILKNVTDNVELARVTIDMTGKTADQYYYAAISPVTLVPGKTYNLWALTTAGGPYYYADDLFTYCGVYNGNTWASVYGSGNGTLGQSYSQLWGVDLDYVATVSYVDLTGNLAPSVSFHGALSATIYKTVVLTSGTTWTVPPDWNSTDNSIEGIGGGGGGDNQQGSGGGAEYAAIFNFSASPGTVIPINIAAGGLGAASSMSYTHGTDGGDTTFNTTTLIAKGGKYGGYSINIGTGGTGTVLFDGGSGNLLYNSCAGGGGGGAGGPNGAGGKGGQDAFITGSANSLYGGGGGAGGANGTAGGAAGGNTSNTTISPGGVGVNGSGSGGSGANAVGVQDGLVGVAGTYWNGTAGPGGGGGGGGTDLNTDGSGAAGGLYGGGGGAAAYHYPHVNATAGGAGAQGVLVITYAALSVGSPSKASVRVMA